MFSKREQNFYNSQIEKDNKAIARIQRASARSDTKEMARIEKAWRKDEKRDRKRFDRETQSL